MKTKSNMTVKGKMENLGKEELYCEWFRCPNCKDSNVRRGFRYCPNCGFDLINYRWGRFKVNLSKLQFEAVKEFDKDWLENFRINKDGSLELEYTERTTGEKRWSKPNMFEITDFIKQFLSDQIQKAVEETRKETIEIIENLKVKHSINPNSPSRERKIIYNEAIMDVIKLCKNK